MIRVLAAILATILATIAFLSMAPLVHATDFAIERGDTAQVRTPSVMASHCLAPCADGIRCLHVCADCIVVLPGQAETAVLVKSKTKGSPGNFMTFNLSRALYRPPKSGWNDRTTERRTQPKRNARCVN